MADRVVLFLKTPEGSLGGVALGDILLASGFRGAAGSNVTIDGTGDINIAGVSVTITAPDDILLIASDDMSLSAVDLTIGTSGDISIGADNDLDIAADDLTITAVSDLILAGTLITVSGPVAPKLITTASASLAALGIGSVAGDPSTLVDGDLWYNSALNRFRKRENGVSSNLNSSSAATFVVHPTAGVGDFTTIQAAINALPAEGGCILVREGTYSLSTSLILPNKDIMIRGCGRGNTIVTMPSFVGPVFKVQDGLTAVRWFVISDIEFTGGSVAGQEFWQFDDEDGFGNCLADRLNITGFETIVNWEQYDETYTRQSVFDISDSFCRAIDNGSTLVKTPQVAGTFAAAVSLKIHESDFWNSPVGSFGVTPFNSFSMDADCDLILDSCRYFYLEKGSSLNGIYSSNTNLQLGTGLPDSGTITFWGNGWDTDDGFDNNTRMDAFGGEVLIVSKSFGRFIIHPSSCGNVCWRIEEGTSDIAITTMFCSLVVSNPGIEVRQTSGVRHHRIHDIQFRKSGSPVSVFPQGCIKIASCQNVQVHNVSFLPSHITGATVVETGSTDFTIVEGCGGLNSGTGMTLIGPNTTVAGVRRFDQGAGSTTGSFVTQFTHANAKGVVGIGTIKNTGDTNALEVRETVIDAFGVTANTITTVNAGNHYLLDPQTNFGTARPPYMSYQVEVRHPVAATTFELHHATEGAL